MRIQTCPFVILGILAVMTGCRPPQSTTHPGTAVGSALVVDLEAVAKAMGRDAEIAQSVEHATENLNAQLIQAAQEMDKQLQKQKAELGASPTAADREKYRQTELRAQQQIRNNKAIAEQARQSVRNQQILLFRKDIKPIAAKLALKRNASVVMIANQDVVWFEPAADLTAEVIAELRAQDSSAAPTPKPAPAPAPESSESDKTNGASAPK